MKCEEDIILNEAMKDVTWIGDSREQVRRFPKAVRRAIGEALRFAQRGVKHPKAKPMRGIGSGVWEIVARYDTDTYRAVYTVKHWRENLCAPCVSKEIDSRRQNPKTRN